MAEHKGLDIIVVVVVVVVLSVCSYAPRVCRDTYQFIT